MIDIEKLKAEVESRSWSGKTHSPGCYLWIGHEDCAIVKLIAELEQERKSVRWFRELANCGNAWKQQAKLMKQQYDEAMQAHGKLGIDCASALLERDKLRGAVRLLLSPYAQTNGSREAALGALGD